MVTGRPRDGENRLIDGRKRHQSGEEGERGQRQADRHARRASPPQVDDERPHEQRKHGDAEKQVQSEEPRNVERG